MSDLSTDLDDLSKQELIELVQMSAKNLVAMDGVWFQVLEEKYGMDMAMDIDAEVWNRYPLSEGKRLKMFLGLGDEPGLEGLAQALRFNYSAHANEASIHWEEDASSVGGRALVYRIEVCRVQAARSRKGMEYHPCKPVGINEYATFAKAIDPRIEVKCLSCYPDITDPSCSCAWKFTIPQG